MAHNSGLTSMSAPIWMDNLIGLKKNHWVFSLELTTMINIVTIFGVDPFTFYPYLGLH
jgi:hypothetical protein